LPLRLRERLNRSDYRGRKLGHQDVEVARQAVDHTQKPSAEPPITTSSKRKPSPSKW
jgi:hypothetical protein